MTTTPSPNATRTLLHLACCLFLLWGISAGCPAPPGPSDGGNNETTPESGIDTHCFTPTKEAPRVTALAYNGQVKNQPYVLRFRIDWEDKDKDLKGGTFQFTVGDTPLNRRFFPDDDETLTKDKGTIELPLLLRPSMTEGKTSLQVELTIWDKAGNASNQPRFRLEVKP